MDQFSYLLWRNPNQLEFTITIITLGFERKNKKCIEGWKIIDAGIVKTVNTLRLIHWAFHHFMLQYSEYFYNLLIKKCLKLTFSTCPDVNTPSTIFTTFN